MIDLQYKDILKQGWEKTKANYGMILFIVIVYFGVSASFSHISETFKDQGFTSLVVQLIVFAVNVFLSIGFIRCFCRRRMIKKLKFQRFFQVEMFF